MASSLALPDLLDRAGKIFELARDLGWAFQQERQWGGGQFGPHRWHPHAETFKALYDGLVGLRDQMEGPPEGFEAVAKCLKQLIPIVRDLRRIEGRFVRDPDGGVLVFWDYMPRLHEVAHDGYRAIQDAKAQGLDDPFRTFIDDFDQRGNAGGGGIIEPPGVLGPVAITGRETEPDDGRFGELRGLLENADLSPNETKIVSILMDNEGKVCFVDLQDKMRWGAASTKPHSTNFGKS